MSAQAVIDSLEFARAGQELQGNLPVSSLARLQDRLYDAGGILEFAVKGGHDDEQRPALDLIVSGSLHLQCQRCLGQLDYPLRLANTLLLLRHGEKLAATVADPDAADCIEASAELDLTALIEDEILLGLPLSPRHEEDDCRNPAQVMQNVGQDNNPPAFSKLAELKRILESKR